MVSKTQDLARFARALSGGELMFANSLREMATFIPLDIPNLQAGMGIFRMYAPGGEALVGNRGDSPGYTSRMTRTEHADLTFLLLTNTGGDDSVVDAPYTADVQTALMTSTATG